MRKRKLSLVLSMTLLPVASMAYGQTADSAITPAAPLAATASTTIPRLVQFSGVAQKVDEKSPAKVTFLLFKDQTGGDAVWIETQTVSFDSAGHYSVYLGETSVTGLPDDLFASGEPRWLEVQIAGQVPQPRVLLVSVPYAMKAADAATLGGLPASAFALAGSSTGSSQQTQAISPDVSANAVTTPGGTLGYLPVYSGPTTIDDSIVFQSATKLGIGTVAPISTLDVNGAVTARGAVTMEPLGTATSTAAKNSQPIDLTASAYNSSTAKAMSPIFALQEEVAGNNTTAPSGTLNLLYGNGTAPAETGLSITNKGIIKFATGQTFPVGSGTITGITTTSPLSGSGTTGSVALSLNLTALETTLNTKYAQLGAANKFTSTITFAPGQTFPGTGTITGITAGTDLIGGGTTGNIKLSVDTTKIAALTGSPVFVGSAGSGATGDTTGTTLNTAGVVGVAGSGNSSGYGGIAGVWGNAAAHVGVLGTSDQYPGVQGVSNSGSGVQGSSTSGYGVQGTSTSNVAVSGTSTSGAGVAGSSTTGAGMVGYTAGTTLGTAGTFGIAGPRTSFNGIAGVWGDAANHVGVFGSSNLYSGVEAVSVSGPGVEGTSTSGNGVHGVSANTSGIFGETSSSSTQDAALFGYAHNNAMGVYGASVNGFGVQGTSNSNVGVLGTSPAGTAVKATGFTGYGLYASSTSGTAILGTAQTGPGGVFTNDSTTTPALEASNYANWPGGTNSFPPSIYGFAGGSGGVGVKGSSSTSVGVYGVGGSSNPAIIAQAAGIPIGVWGDISGQKPGPGNGHFQEAAVVGTAGNNAAGYFQNNSIQPAILTYNYSTGDGGYLFKSLEAASPDGMCGIGGKGELTCTGQVKTLATTDDEHTVETYSMQSPESWMEDFGSATVKNGVVTVTIDPLFAKTVSATTDYHVFLTPNGDSKGLFVIAKTPTSFEVRESGGGQSTLAFDYRIVAKRRGFEKQRMTDVTEEFKALKALNDLRTKAAALLSISPVATPETQAGIESSIQTRPGSPSTPPHP